MNRVWCILFYFFCFANSNSQCLYIKSILADACVPGTGCTNSLSPTCSCEGKNEMVLLRVGNQPISIADITFKWPNNTFRGIATPNATTSANVASLQASVLGCGLLLEPVGGILPANRDVLMVLSTDMCTSANSFTNLNDTLVMIFQNPGNFQGHFANASITTSLNPRVTEFTVTGSPACTGSVSYLPALLTNTNNISYSVAGNYSTPAYDGGAIDYDAVGTPTYINRGCNAPFIPMGITLSSPNNTICPSNSVALHANITGGNFSELFWLGGSGNFSAPTTTGTSNQYFSGAGDLGIVSLSCVVTKTCGAITASAITVFTVLVAEVPSITASTSVSVCPGQSVQLSYIITNAANVGTVSSNWTTGGLGNVENVSLPGIYTVTLTNICGTTAISYTVGLADATTLAINPIPSEICGTGTVLSAVSNATNFSWSTGASTQSTSVNSSGVYTVNVSGDCGIQSATVLVNIIPQPSISILPANASLCDSLTYVTLTINSNTSYTWSSGSTSPTLMINKPGTYFALAMNQCGMAHDTILVNHAGVSPIFTANPLSGPSPLAVNFTNLTAGVNSYTWNYGTGNTSNSINGYQVFGTGAYTVSLTADNGPCTGVYTIEIISDLIFGPIPELLTPNGDGKNDFFEIKGISNYPQNKLSIFNRWGNLVYFVKGYNNQWEGYANVSGVMGSDRLPTGTYYILLELGDKTNTVYKGYVQLQY